MSTKAVLSPEQRKPGLLAQPPSDPELRKLIYSREIKDLSQDEPAQNSYIVTRVGDNIRKILDPDQNRLWFRAQITGKISEHLYAATLFGQHGILFEGTLLLKPGQAWENSQPLITVNKSCIIDLRMKMISSIKQMLLLYPHGAK